MCVCSASEARTGQISIPFFTNAVAISEVGFCTGVRYRPSGITLLMDGQGLPMKAWIIYKEKTIRQWLEVVMKGVQWKNWSSGKAEDPRAIQLREHLKALSPDRFPILIPAVKKAVGLSTVSRRVWQGIVQQALDGTRIAIQQRRFVLI